MGSEMVESIGIQWFAKKVEAAEGEILAVSGDFGTAARKIRSPASDFVPRSGEIGIAACVFGTAERVFGTAERKIGTAEKVFGTAEMKFGTTERVFGTAEGCAENGRMVRDPFPCAFGESAPAWKSSLRPGRVDLAWVADAEGARMELGMR